MRSFILRKKMILGMAHLGSRAFEQIGGEVVQVTATVFLNGRSSSMGDYLRLVDYDGSVAKEAALLRAAKKPDFTSLHHVNQASFLVVPGSSLIYWAPKRALDNFNEAPSLKTVIDARIGLITGNVNRFIKMWHEVAIGTISFDTKPGQTNRHKWVPCTKGGEYRLWYGNNWFVLNWENDGWEMKNDNYKNGRLRAHNFNGEQAFKEGLSWSTICSGDFHCRYVPHGFMFDTAGPFCEVKRRDRFGYVAGLMSSSTYRYYMSIMNPTLNYPPGYLEAVPYIDAPEEVGIINNLVDGSICISKADWDSFEASWDFEWHPLAPSSQERAKQLTCGTSSDARSATVSLISERFARWSDECDERFNQLKANEEELNRIFARIYGMEGEVPIEVPEDKVSVRRADLVRDVKSLVSYGVGCIMGRYSAFAPGLILADVQQTVDDFKAKVPDAGFLPDDDAIIPVLDGEWFGDDIVAQFRKWLEVTYGTETLDENVKFIENALGKDLRKYFVKEFYKDHCATYQVTGSGKRPIYWMFASPKGSFQVLVYMHRYTPSTVGQILTKYLREYVEKLNAKIGQLEQSDRAADNRQADKYRAVVRELTDWERDVIYPLANERIDIDLDDGVKVNYNKFPHALAKVAGLSTWK